MAASNPERREVREFIEGIELRAAPAGSSSPGTLSGYAAVFNRTSVDLGMFREVLAPGCFKDALARSDIRALYNHEPDHLLGRTTSGTLRLAEDEVGLRMECDLPDTQLGRDLAELCRRGDLTGQSFSFTTDSDSWDYSASPPLRTVRAVGELYDVGPVTYPAYSDTSVACRAYNKALETREQPPAIEPAPEPEPASEPAPEPIPGPDAPDYSSLHARLRLLEVS
jgi:HK97 family phage prohead protease